jgi:hypothetical protein
MSIRFSRVATAVLSVATVLLVAQTSWAIRQGLTSNPADWNLDYDVQVEELDSDNLLVEFTVADEGRLKPFYSIDLVSFSKQTDNQGGRAYDMNEPIKLAPAADGKRVGKVQVPRRFADRAKIRIISLHVDGKRQPSGGVFFDIPIIKHWKNAPATSPDVASPPRRSKVRK